MNERCETGCRRRAIVLWWNEERNHDIELCGVDSDRLAPSLVAKDYQQMHDDRLEQEHHPTLGAVTSDPTTH